MLFIKCLLFRKRFVNTLVLIRNIGKCGYFLLQAIEMPVENIWMSIKERHVSLDQVIK